MELTWSGKIAAEARAEERIEATQDAILLFWKTRHPESAAELESRIRTVSDLGRLYEILERVPDAASIDDLELGNGFPPAAG